MLFVRRLVFLLPLLLFLCAHTVSGQHLNPLYRPEPSPDMPSWASLLYVDKPNAFDLEKAYAAYYEKHPFEKNSYTRYYQRWRHSVERYIQPDGSIREFTDAAWAELQRQRTEERRQASGLRAGNWRSVGPLETYWKKEDNSAQPMCPWQVNVYCFDIYPADPNVLYCGSETGDVYKTTDKGLNWTSVSDNVNFYGTPEAVCIHPANSNTVFVGARYLYRTTDGGNTWNSVFSNGSLYPNAIRVHPGNTQVVLASTNIGFYRSNDGGTSWTQVLTNRCTDVRVNPVNGDVYVLRKNTTTNFYEFWKSTDQGASFTLKSNGWPTGLTGGEGLIGVTPASATTVYAALLVTNDNPRVMKSTDGGENWTVVATGGTAALGMNNGQGFYDMGIVVSATNASHVIVATTTAYKSTDGGVNYTAIGGYSGAFSIHPDIQEMRAAGTDTWIATDGGLTHSTDFFTATANANARIYGINGSDFWGFGQGWNEDLLVGGRYHNGNTAWYENYPDSKYLRMGGAEAGTGYILHGRPRNALFSDLGDGWVIASSFDQPAEGRFTFTKRPNEDGYGFDASELEIHPYCYNIFFVGEGNALWKSTDGGINFTQVKDFGSRLKKFEISRSNPQVLYVATAAGLWKTTDGGANWTSITLPAGMSVNQLSLALSFTNDQELWISSPSASSGNRVYKTTNGGGSWTNLTTAAINGYSYFNIVHQAGTNGGVYIVSNGGAKVYYRNNALSDWVDYSTGMPLGYAPVKTIPFYRDEQLRTAGNRGILSSPFYETSNPLSQPTVDKISSNCLRDTFYFEDYSVLKHAGATWQWSFSGPAAPAYVSSFTARNPKVVFAQTGTYSLTLLVTDGTGKTSSKTLSSVITVTNLCAQIDTVPGKAMLQTGTSDYAVTPPMGFTTNNLTLSAWIRPNGNQVSFAGLIFSPCDGATGMNLMNSNRLGYHWQDSPGSYNWTGGPVIPVDVWSHVALVITPSTATVYLNGQPYTRSATHNPVTFSSGFNLGNDRGYTTRTFAGLMDEVCIYNRALSTNEVRELMNLTRKPSTDTTLFAYYQINEDTISTIYDKAGNKHATLVGGATRQTSTAPLGGGKSFRMTVSSGGAKSFTGTDLILGFPASGTFPQGDVVVTRINLPPDQSPSAFPLSRSYWVIRNYGTNQTFSQLDSIRFNYIGPVSAGTAASPSYLKLYKRQSHEDGNTWGAFIDSGDAATAGNDGTATFSTGNGITSFSQFVISNESPPLAVQWLGFNARLLKDNRVELEWIASSDGRTARFGVERASDGQTFETIADVAAQPGAGTFSYKSWDDKPLHGTNVYRIRETMQDGNRLYSEVRIIVLDEIPGTVVVYPNPLVAGHELFLRTSLREPVVFRLFNSQGKLVREQQFQEQGSLLTGELIPGVYFYELRGNTRHAYDSLLLR